MLGQHSRNGRTPYRRPHSGAGHGGLPRINVPEHGDARAHCLYSFPQVRSMLLGKGVVAPARVQRGRGSTSLEGDGPGAQRLQDYLTQMYGPDYVKPAHPDPARSASMKIVPPDPGPSPFVPDLGLGKGTK